MPPLVIDTTKPPVQLGIFSGIEDTYANLSNFFNDYFYPTLKATETAAAMEEEKAGIETGVLIAVLAVVALAIFVFPAAKG